MIRYILFFFLVTTFSISIGNNLVFGSWMAHRPAYERIAALNGSWYIYNHPEASAAAQLTTLYSRSTNQAAVGSFYALHCSNDITIKGDAIDPTGSYRQVRAEWLTLPATFDSAIAPCCEREMATTILQLRKNIALNSPISLLRCCYCELMVPITIIKHRLSVVLSNPQGAAAVAALQRPALLYQRWLSSSESIGPSCVRITFGSTFCHYPSWQLTAGGYGQLSTESRNQNYQIFPAYRDQNGHSALGIILHMQAPLLVNPDGWGIVFSLDADSTCLLDRTQRRTVDLYDKRWSRYMLYNGQNGTLAVPGTQILTIPVDVHPYNQTDIAFLLNYEQPCYHAAIGYALWARSQEGIFNPCPPPPGYGIAGTGTTEQHAIPIGNTASASTIAKLANNDTQFIPITLNDINLCSASSPATFTNTLIGFIRYQRRTGTVGISAAIGGWGEWARSNHACSTWGLWVQVTGSI
ncbi:hypothetical protein M1466_03950 [Candidatus Dependentiae bacterium]|nr:hypothetical protein [Candidatus Dependentiae bacterium]